MHMQGLDAKYHRQKESKRFQPGFVRMLPGLLACVTLLGVCAAVSAAQQKPPVSAAAPAGEEAPSRSGGESVRRLP